MRVEVVDCPDLTEEPFNLAGCGLGGSPILLESGGSINLLTVKDRLKLYNIKTLSQQVMGDEKDLLILGTGAGPIHLNGLNCEIIVNMKIAHNGTIKNNSYEAVVEGADEKMDLKTISQPDMFAYLTNLFLSEGKRGKVLRVFCKKRIGPLNFLESIRLTLFGHYRERCVGLGGVFHMKNGTFTQHLARNADKLLPYQFDLKKYDMPGPFNAVGTLLSHPYVSP